MDNTTSLPLETIEKHSETLEDIEQNIDIHNESDNTDSEAMDTESCSETESNLSSNYQFDENEKRSNITEKVDRIADKIINTFVVKKKIPMFMRENEDNISYEESEIRLIFMGQFFAMVFSLILTIMISIQSTNENFTGIKIMPQQHIKSELNMPIPSVLIMGMYSKGHIVTLRLNKSMQ